MDAGQRGSANLSHGIYLKLRRRLIVGDLAPGDTLSIRTLAQAFRVSAMPVREALKHLEYDRALSGAAKRAYRVPAITPASAADLFFLRATLESAAAELAMDHLTPRDLARLRGYSRATDRAWAQQDARGFLQNNFLFHALINRRSGNRDLSELATVLHARSGPWLGRAIRELSDRADWASDHMAIVDAFQAGDRPRVRRLIAADVNWGTGFFRRPRQDSPQAPRPPPDPPPGLRSAQPKRRAM